MLRYVDMCCDQRAIEDLTVHQKSIGSRLGLVRKQVADSINQFGLITGLPVSSLKKYESGTSVPGGEALQAMSKAGVNIHWLLTGEGTMLLQTPVLGVNEEASGYMNKNKGKTFTQDELQKRRSMIDMIAQTTGNPDQVWSALLMELTVDYGLGEHATKRIMETLETLKSIKGRSE
jgi:transcriptional regulator with XRE-family HTH domain